MLSITHAMQPETSSRSTESSVSRGSNITVDRVVGRQSSHWLCGLLAPVDANYSGAIMTLAL